MELKRFLARLILGYAEIDRVNALEKVYDELPEGGTVIYLTSCEFSAFKAEQGHAYSATSVFERNNNNELIEITTDSSSYY